MLIAGPNLTLDRTLSLDELRPGEVLRASEALVAPGGKGVNVARVARALGASAVLVGFVPGRTGRVAAELLAEEGIELAGVAVAGEIRHAALVLERSGRVTVLNEPGPALADGDWDAYERAVGRQLDGRTILVCSGSVPPGAPADAYARLATLARTRGLRVLVDASGETLAAALAARPDLVTPNLAEAEGVLGRAGPDALEAGTSAARERALAAAPRLVRLGAGAAVVTAGEAGVALATASDTSWRSAPAGLRVRNPVGAGDALAGALAAALARGAPLEEAVVAGLAAASASVEQLLPGAVDPARAAELERQLAAPA